MTAQEMTMESLPRLVRRARVQELTGYSKSFLYSQIAAGKFPKPLPKEEGEAISLWVLSEVVAHVQARINRRGAK